MTSNANRLKGNVEPSKSTRGTRTALYLRVSSEMQKEQGTSIPAQRHELTALAIKNGWLIVAEYRDEAESARTDKRPQFQLMMHDAIVKHEFEQILVYSADRFARNSVDAALYRLKLRNAGVRLISRTEPTDDTPVGRMVESMFDSLAQYQSDMLSMVTIRGQREVASRGFLPGGPAPFGYQIKKIPNGSKMRNSLEPHPIYADVLRQVFERRAAGSSRREIAAWLDELGVPPPRRTRWSDRTIDEIAANEVYLGTLRFNRRPSRSAKQIRENPIELQIVTENAFPALVSRELFDAANRMRRRRGRENVRQYNRHIYLLTGLLRCAACGGSVISCNSDNRHDLSRRYHYYACKNQRKNRSCDAPLVRCDDLDAAVLHELRSQSLDEAVIERLWEEISEESTDPSLRAARMAVVEKTRARDNLIRALEHGVSTTQVESVLERIRSLDDDIKTQQDRLSKLEVSRDVDRPRSISELRSRLDALGENLHSSDRKELKSAVHSFVAEVILNARARKARVAYILPMRRPSVLSNGSCGGVI